MPKVLIVDDSLIVRRNLQKFLQKLNFEVIGDAKNGIEAVEQTRRLKPELITMDITMPEMDGIEAVKKIREFNDEVKIIMSTSHGQEKMVLDSIKAGARGYMLKPITEDKLIVALKKAFPNHKFPTDISDEILEETRKQQSSEDIEEIQL